MDQHTAMNDAGSFLIETCEDAASHQLKQQLLLMNGRWRELFVQVKQVKRLSLTVKVKPHLCSADWGGQDVPDWLAWTAGHLFLLQYACVSETDKWRKDHLKAASALKELLDTAEAKLNTPVQMSFLNLRSFLQDVEVGIDAGLRAEGEAHILIPQLTQTLLRLCHFRLPGKRSPPWRRSTSWRPAVPSFLQRRRHRTRPQRSWQRWPLRRVSWARRVPLWAGEPNHLLITVKPLIGLSVGERTMPDLRAGVPRPAATLGGNGEARDCFLPSPGTSQSHHCCCQRSRNTESEPAETKVAGETRWHLTCCLANGVSHKDCEWFFYCSFLNLGDSPKKIRCKMGHFCDAQLIDAWVACLFLPLRNCWTSSKPVSVASLWLRGTTTHCRGRSPPAKCSETLTCFFSRRGWQRYRARLRFVPRAPCGRTLRLLQIWFFIRHGCKTSL